MIRQSKADFKDTFRDVLSTYLGEFNSRNQAFKKALPTA
jgi:hypothetical protein